MPIRQNITAQECISEFEKAAREHYEAGFVLLANNNFIGVQLMGLAVEMLLKASVFRYIGYAESQHISLPDLREAQTDAKNCGVIRKAENFHDLVFWAELLIAVRKKGLLGRKRSSGAVTPKVLARPVLKSDEDILLLQVGSLSNNWNIVDRYKSLQGIVTIQDLNEVFDATMAVVELYDGGRI